MQREEDKNLSIEGKRIYLRKLRISDIGSRYLKWMQDHEINQFLISRFEQWSIKKLKGYVRKINRSHDYLLLAIILKDSGEYIGNIKLGPIHREYKYSDVGVLIGEKSFWGKGLATEAIKLIVDFGFNKLGLHRLSAGTFANNIGSIKAFKKAGFSIEGRRKKKYLYNGNYIDEILLGVLRK